MPLHFNKELTMKQTAKKPLVLISINTAVMVVFFLIKYILLPSITDIKPSVGNVLYFVLTYAAIPLISIVGMILERHVRFWIIPDFVYCALAFAFSEGSPYGIGLFGVFDKHYRRDIALLEEFIAFVLIVLVQLLIKLIIKLVLKIKSKGSKSES